MKKVLVKIIKGKQLSTKKAIEIDKIFQKEFPGNEPVDPKRRKLFFKDIFFMVYDKKKIISVGRLRPAKIIFLKKQYNILGIADIVSVIKKKGYGKILMKSMHKYLKDKKKVGIGFCHRKNSIFYKKSGLKLSKGLVKNFVYISPEGKIIKNKWDDDVFYPEENEKLIKTILQNPKEKVILKCPFW